MPIKIAKTYHCTCGCLYLYMNMLNKKVYNVVRDLSKFHCIFDFDIETLEIDIKTLPVDT
jgi:hypothetical protein